MPHDSVTAAIFASGLLVGIAVSLLASMVPDLPQAIRDLRPRHARPVDNPGVLASERAISKRFYQHLATLGAIVALVVVTALFLP